MTPVALPELPDELEPREANDLHRFALDYRTAISNREVILAWSALDTHVEQLVRQERERCIHAMRTCYYPPNTHPRDMRDVFERAIRNQD